MHMPERIWMLKDGDGPWFIKPVQPSVEYRRADLPPTLEAAKALPEIAALVEALEFGKALIEGDSFGSEWKRGQADFRRKARAALTAIAQDKQG